MAAYRYLIVGGGMAADAAVAGIRERDADGSIGVVAAEADAPYSRPPLSKGLWKGKPLEKVWRRAAAEQATLLTGREVRKLDLAGRHVVDDQGEAHGYERLLLATGGRPRRLPFGGDDIIYFRTLADYRRLRAASEPGEPIAVIGGGFIGSELAAALAMNGAAVTLLFPEPGIGARVFPAELSSFLNDYYRGKGVTVLPGEMVAGLEHAGREQVLRTKTGREVRAKAVVAGLGLQPNTELAEAAGLTVDNGIVVDDCLRTSAEGVYAAGDVAVFYNPALGKRLRVEHEDNALTMGKVAGRNLAGAEQPYHHLPFFYSDLFDLGYEAVGELDSRLATVIDWKKPYAEGVVYYLDGGRVRGVLLWNVWDQVDAARRLIGESGPFAAADLVERLPAKTAA
jgi:3-phenylpropionate/trans-cinnamate dioxygenase ferredoxin reductase subunit